MSYNTKAPALPNNPTPRIINKYFKASIVVLPSFSLPDVAAKRVTANSAAHVGPGILFTMLALLALRHDGRHEGPAHSRAPIPQLRSVHLPRLQTELVGEGLAPPVRSPRGLNAARQKPASTVQSRVPIAQAQPRPARSPDASAQTSPSIASN